MKVCFIRAFEGWRVGHRAQMRTGKAMDLIERKIAIEYTGEWPPRKKTKFNLKDLR
jgi:hypothetical protein